MRSDVQEYALIAPSSLGAVLKLLAEEPGVHTPIAGGTELMVALGAGRLASHTLVSLNRVRELRFIEVKGAKLHIGAGCTFTDLRNDAAIGVYVPLLRDAAAWVGGIANQNRGTLGGNLANASPAADSSPALLVYDAEINLISTTGMRTLPYSEFHLGYKKTALRPDELIHSVAIDISSVEAQAPVTYIRKVGTRNAMAISKVVIAGIARCEHGVVEEVRLGAASLAPTPVRLYAAERAITGKQLDGGTIRAARAALATECRPIDDIRSTAEYRAAVAGNLLEEFLLRCGGRF